MSTATGIYLSLVLLTYSRYATCDRPCGKLRTDLSVTGALAVMDPDVELVLQGIENETDIEELLELCAVEEFKAHNAGLLGTPASLLDSCRRRLRDLMLTQRNTWTNKNKVRWKYVAAGVRCVEQVGAYNISIELCKCKKTSREAKTKCAQFCKGRVGFTIFLEPGSLHCSCCSTMSSWIDDRVGDRARQYRLVSSTGVKRSRGNVDREDAYICHPDKLQSITRGTVNFLLQDGQPVNVSITKATPPAFFKCPHLRIQDPQTGSRVYGDGTLLVWMYPLGKNPVWCQNSNKHFRLSVWRHLDANNISHDVSVCHTNTYYPLPMLKASKRTTSIHVDDVATYGHVETNGRNEKGVCKNLFLRALEAADALMQPLVVELGFNAMPTDKGCGCYAGAFFTKFNAFSLTINGVSFDICSAAELDQICGSGELLKGQWSMRQIEACSQEFDVARVVAFALAACVIALAVAAAACRLFRQV